MPAWIIAFIGGLVEAATTVVGRILIFLGISVVTYSGVSEALSFAESYISSQWSGLPVYALQLLGALGIGTDVGIITGAIAARLSLSGLTSSGLSRWVTRAPS